MFALSSPGNRYHKILQAAIRKSNGWYAGEDFELLLRTERERNMRAGGPAVYVLFDLSGHIETPGLIGDHKYYDFLAQTLEIISANTRFIDPKSITDDYSVSVLLVDTSIKQAKIFIDKISKKLFDHFQAQDRPDCLNLMKSVVISAYSLEEIAKEARFKNSPEAAEEVTYANAVNGFFNYPDVDQNNGLKLLTGNGNMNGPGVNNNIPVGNGPAGMKTANGNGLQVVNGSGYEAEKCREQEVVTAENGSGGSVKGHSAGLNGNGLRLTRGNGGSAVNGGGPKAKNPHYPPELKVLYGNETETAHNSENEMNAANGAPTLIMADSLPELRIVPGGSLGIADNKRKKVFPANGAANGKKAINGRGEAKTVLEEKINFYFNWKVFSLAEAPAKLKGPLPFSQTGNSCHFGYHFLKRLMDIAGALAGIILLLPVMFIIAIAIKLDSKGPVLFRQKRVGYRGKLFTFLKFRSMKVDCDDEIHREYVQKLIQGENEDINNGSEDNPLFKIDDDPRVTKVGNFLRKTSLDEFPQLFNVLLGGMSLVGPRPPIPYEVDAYQKWHVRRIVEARPGITGMWQVYGRNRTTFDDMVRLDIQYMKKRSILTDLKLIFNTIALIFNSKSGL